MVIKWMKRLKWMRISKYAIIICLLLSIIFAGFTVYGIHTGNFTVYIQNKDVNIAAYMEEDKSDLGNRFNVPMLEDMNDSTYEYMADTEKYSAYDYNHIVNGLGVKHDERFKLYLCFSFVLVNLSERMINYDMELTVIDTKDGVYKGDMTNALRIMVFREDDFYGEQGTRTIYAKPEKSEENKQKLVDSFVERGHAQYETKDFISDTQIFHEDYYGLDEGEEVKFTVVMWLEGNDPECDNSLYNSRIKMRLDIVGY